MAGYLTLNQEDIGSSPIFTTNITLSSNGRTSGFGPDNGGSSPSGVTNTGCGLIGKSPALGAGHHAGSSPVIPTNTDVRSNG